MANEVLGTVPRFCNIHKATAAVPGNQGADCLPICNLTFRSLEAGAGSCMLTRKTSGADHHSRG